MMVAIMISIGPTYIRTLNRRIVINYDSDSGSGLQLHTQSSPGERSGEFSQNGKFGQNGTYMYVWSER